MIVVWALISITKPLESVVGKNMLSYDKVSVTSGLPVYHTQVPFHQSTTKGKDEQLGRVDGHVNHYTMEVHALCMLTQNYLKLRILGYLWLIFDDL